MHAAAGARRLPRVDGAAGGVGVAAGAHPRRRAPPHHALRRLQGVGQAHRRRQGVVVVLLAERRAAAAGDDVVPPRRLDQERGRRGLHRVPEAVVGRGRRGQAVERDRRRDGGRSARSGHHQAVVVAVERDHHRRRPGEAAYHWRAPRRIFASLACYRRRRRCWHAPFDLAGGSLFQS